MKTIISWTAAFVTLAAVAFAAPPKTINYQGYLTDSAGVPVTATAPAKTMGFALYSTTSGATPLWNESQDVTVDKGIYNVELGKTTPIILPFDTQYYLGVTVSPETSEMTPRQALTNTPYAFRAGCIPGDMLNCYTGPFGTLNVGECRSGLRTCRTDGSFFGPCVGEILPSPELRDGKDNNCNGLIDDGAPLCLPEATQPCGSSIGMCVQGIETCIEDGSAFGPCIGAVGPTQEQCDNLDNDCDGAVDNSISYPPVTNGQYACMFGSTMFFCNPGYGSCVTSGVCDTDIANNLLNCGGCGVVCLLPNAAPNCLSGLCGISSCNPGFANCNSYTVDGCEINTMTNSSNCGSCGNICTPGSACSSGTCKKSGGQICAADTDCLTGFCTDGVCCNSRCGGTCEKCNQAGQLGLCSPISAGQDPDNECTAQSVSTCGTNGLCSGSRSCALYSSGTVAVAANCSAGTYTLPSTCSGSGSVIPGGNVSCSPYTCLNSTACRTSCSTTIDCASGFACSNGVCQTSIPADGTPCDDGSACTVNDTYQGGICTGVPIICDDGIFCTLDTCDTATGCIHTPTDALCDDGSLCNGSETCSAIQGGCVAGTPLICDDGNACTTDQCDAQSGCLNSILPDGTNCGSGLTCQAGACG